MLLEDGARFVRVECHEKTHHLDGVFDSNAPAVHELHYANRKGFVDLQDVVDDASLRRLVADSQHRDDLMETMRRALIGHHQLRQWVDFVPKFDRNRFRIAGNAPNIQIERFLLPEAAGSESGRRRTIALLAVVDELKHDGARMQRQRLRLELRQNRRGENEAIRLDFAEKRIDEFAGVREFDQKQENRFEKRHVCGSIHCQKDDFPEIGLFFGV